VNQMRNIEKLLLENLTDGLLEPFDGNLTAYLQDLQRRQKELCAGHEMIRTIRTAGELTEEADRSTIILKEE
jgi:hypothetical protein